MYGKHAERGWEARSPRWQEMGEKGKKYTKLLIIINTLQMKKAKEAGAHKSKAGSRIIPFTSKVKLGGSNF